MTTVIIGGGSGVRNAVTHLETASLTMTDVQRNLAEKHLAEIAEQLDGYAKNPSTLA